MCLLSELLLMHPDIDATLVNNQGDTAMEVAARSVLSTTTMGTIHYDWWIKVMPLTSFSVLRTVDLDPDCEENSWNQGFSFYLLTEGSGSGRPINTWIQILIHNTDSKLFSLVKFNHRYPYFNLPPYNTSVFVNMFTAFLFQERAAGSPLSRCPAPIHLPAQRTQGVTAVRGGRGVSWLLTGAPPSRNWED